MVKNPNGEIQQMVQRIENILKVIPEDGLNFASLQLQLLAAFAVSPRTIEKIFDMLVSAGKITMKEGVIYAAGRE